MTNNITVKGNHNGIELIEKADGTEMYYSTKTGKCAMSIRGIARMLDCHQGTISNQAVKFGLGKELQMYTQQGIQGVNLIEFYKLPTLLSVIVRSRMMRKTKHLASVLLEAFSKNSEVDSILSYYHSNKKQDVKKPKRNEASVVEKCLEYLGSDAVTEVKSVFGRIDILTDNLIIEVKHFKNIHGACGQLLFYADEYPSRKKLLVLFGKQIGKKDLSPYVKVTSKYDIEILALTSKHSYLKLARLDSKSKE